MLDYPFSGAANKDIGEGAVSMGAHNNEITILFLCGFSYNFSRCSIFD